MKRHQQGHEKQAAAAHEAALRGDLLDRDYDSSSTGTVKSKKKRVQSAAEVPVEDNGPVKIARVGRACCRCSKSKYVNVTLSTSLDSIANKARPPRERQQTPLRWPAPVRAVPQSRHRMQL